jgi:hypothetical protein
MLQPVHDVTDSLLEMRKREILEPDFGETNGPAAGVGEFVASPYTRSRYRLGENPGHRRRSFAAYAAAAAQWYGWIPPGR